MEYARSNRESLNKEIQKIAENMARMQQEIKNKRLEDQVKAATAKTVGAYGKKDRSPQKKKQNLDQSSSINTSKSLIRVSSKRAIQKANQIQSDQILINNKSYQERINLQKQDYFSQISKQFHDRIRKLQTKLYKEQKQAITKEKQNKKLLLSVHPLQSHFQSCILLTKQQILQRKHPDQFRYLLKMHQTLEQSDSVSPQQKTQNPTQISGYLQPKKKSEAEQSYGKKELIGSMTQESLQSHVDIVQKIKFSQFTESDKRHSLQLFLRDQQVKWFIYQSLFGHIQNDLLVPQRNPSSQLQQDYI